MGKQNLLGFHGKFFDCQHSLHGVDGIEAYKLHQSNKATKGRNSDTAFSLAVNGVARGDINMTSARRGRGGVGLEQR